MLLKLFVYKLFSANFCLAFYLLQANKHLEINILAKKYAGNTNYLQ